MSVRPVLSFVLALLPLCCASSAHSPPSTNAPDGAAPATFDASHFDAGPLMTTIAQGAGLDILSYDPVRHHLYVQGTTSRDLGIIGISTSGQPSLLGVVTTAASSTSTTDEDGHVFVADPENGALIGVRDTYPATK